MYLWQAGMETWLLSVSSLPDVFMQLLSRSFSETAIRKKILIYAAKVCLQNRLRCIKTYNGMGGRVTGWL